MLILTHQLFSGARVQTIQLSKLLLRISTKEQWLLSSLSQPSI